MGYYHWCLLPMDSTQKPKQRGKQLFPRVTVGGKCQQNNLLTGTWLESNLEPSDLRINASDHKATN